MKKAILCSAIGLAGAAAVTAAGAQDVGRVISKTPVVQQVAVQHQVCNQPVPVQQPSTGGGAVVGAVVGGLLGNTVGQGMGRAAATGVGIVTGAAVGDSVERRTQPYAYAPACTTQTSYENRTVGYDVQYEYAGRQYSTRLPYDPGDTIRVQVSPASDPNAQGGPPPVSQEPQAVILREVPPGPYPPYGYGYGYGYPAPVYYPRYYYPPVGVSLGFGYVYHGHRH